MPRLSSLDPASWCGVTRCDAESRNTLPVIPHLMRNPGIPGREIRAKAIPTRGTFLDPASWCGVTLTLDPASLCGVTHATGPRIVVRGDPHTGPCIECGVTRCDAESRNTLPVIPHLMRNPGIPANECLAFPLWTPHRGAG